MSIGLDELLKPIFIEGLFKTINWYNSDNSHYLRAIFNQVGFKDKDEKEDLYWILPLSLSSRIIYPTRNSDDLEKAKKEVLQEINEGYEAFSEEYLSYLNSNQLFFLLEKFGGNVPLDESGTVSIFDSYKIKAIRAIIQSNRESLRHKDNLLINIDLSGIQRFIYNITSTGALKNLRARSFFIELLCNHIIYKTLNYFNLHYANVLLNGGGSIYILSGCPEDYRDLFNEIDYSINKWLLKEFNGRLYATFSSIKCSDDELRRDISSVLRELSKETFAKKRRKFNALIEKGEFSFIEKDDPKYQSCEICYKDDPTSQFQRISPYPYEERFRCFLCHKLVELGNQIPKTRFIYSCAKETEKCLQIEDSYYLLSEEKKDLRCLWVLFEDRRDFIKDIDVFATHIFARTYTRRISDLPDAIRKEISNEKRALESKLSTISDKEISDKETESIIREEIEALKDENTVSLEYMAKSSEGAELIGVLRMDADNMGKILYHGFYGNTILESLSFFSRSVNYFFKLHLESLCKGVKEGNNSSLSLKDHNGRNVHTIYAGGDDLFILGAWNDTASLAIDIGEAFKKYTCENIDIGLSGGFILHTPKTPVNKMAETSMIALKTAKNNTMPCWMCRREWTACPLYDMGNCLRKDSFSPFFTEYLSSRQRRLHERLKSPRYSQEPSRLKLTLRWKGYDSKTKNIVDEVEEYILKPLEAFKEGVNRLGRGFFHNTLNLLDIWYDEGLLYLPKIVWAIVKVKKELKRLRIESEEARSLYDLYEMYLHFDNKRFSTLHIPLSWIILLTRGGEKD